MYDTPASAVPGSGCAAAAAGDECATEDDAPLALDPLALRKRLLVPYSMFSRVIDSKRRVIRPSTKEIILHQLFTNQLPEMLEDGDPTRLVGPRTKILVFSTYPMIQMLHQRAADEAFGPDSSVCISGKVLPKQRDPLRRRFRNDPKTRVLFLTLETGAHGLNIPEADIIVFTDAWWNPAKELQAEYRARRPLRDHPIHVYHFLISHTIESYVIQRQNEKKELIETMMACDDPITNILQTNQRLRALQRFDALTMRQVADDAIKSRRCINEQYARGFIRHTKDAATGAAEADGVGDTSADADSSSHVSRQSDLVAVGDGSSTKRDGMRPAAERTAQAQSNYQSAFCAFVRSMNTEVSDDSWFVAEDDAELSTATLRHTGAHDRRARGASKTSAASSTAAAWGLDKSKSYASLVEESVMDDDDNDDSADSGDDAINYCGDAPPRCLPDDHGTTTVLGKHSSSAYPTTLHRNKRRRRHELLVLGQPPTTA
jgi:hypothetical protein